MSAGSIGLIGLELPGAEEPSTAAVLALALLLLGAGFALLRWLFPLVERVLCPPLERPREPAYWGGAELVAVVGVIFVGITGWYSLLVILGGKTPIDALLATDLALLMGAGVATILARRAALVATPPGRLEAVPAAIGLGPWRGLSKPLLFAAATLFLATPAILGVMNLWPLLLELIGREAMPQDVLLDVLAQRGLGLVLALVLASLVGPALEELLFRGFLQPALRMRLGGTGAILATSFLFASIHGLDAAAPVFCLSLVLGYLRERTDRLEPAILAHCLWNGTTLAWSLAFLP